MGDEQRKIGKYEIVEQIGVGGFGVVYKAWDPFIQRWVALKSCSSSDEESRRRFFREAQLAGSLQHPNITLIFDFGVEGETPYFVQEFLPGMDLDELLRDRRLSIDAAVAILLQVCEGLDFAHGRGIIHRDIKPANVRVLDDGSIKIMDFGIARFMETDSRLTRTGVALGTAGYLAPEQLTGKPLDARTDLFSLGVMAYEMLTGLRPFSGPNISNVIYQILNQNPEPPRKVNPHCPERLSSAVMKAMAREPHARYSSVREFGSQLGSVLGKLPSQVKTPTTVTAVVRQEITGPATARIVENGIPPVTQLAETPLDTIPDADNPVARRRRRSWPWVLGLLALVTGAAAWWVLLAGSGPHLITALLAPPPVPTAVPLPTPVPTATPVPTPAPVDVELVVSPPSDVSVDGRSLGTIAASTVSLQPGRHEIVQSIAGYRTKTWEVDVDAQTGQIPLELPPFGEVSVLQDFGVAIQGTTVFVDGRKLGSLPLLDQRVEAGRHELRVVWPDGSEYRQQLDLAATGSSRITVRPGAPGR